VAEYKPADLSLGVVDILAIFVPGAALTFLLAPQLPPAIGAHLPPFDTDTSGWLAFAVVAYFLGHVVHALGAIPDGLYDHIYVPLFKRRRGEEPVLIRTRQLIQNSLGGWTHMTHPLSWAGSYVHAYSPSATLELERLGGESKFFRSFVIILPLGLYLAGGDLERSDILWLVAVWGFAVWRYITRRWKFTEQTYEYFVLLSTVPAVGTAQK
jgi:hypothetical protein